MWKYVKCIIVTLSSSESHKHNIALFVSIRTSSITVCHWVRGCGDFHNMDTRFSWDSKRLSYFYLSYIFLCVYIPSTTGLITCLHFKGSHWHRSKRKSLPPVRRSFLRSPLHLDSRKGTVDEEAYSGSISPLLTQIQVYLTTCHFRCTSAYQRLVSISSKIISITGFARLAT